MNTTPRLLVFFMIGHNAVLFYRQVLLSRFNCHSDVWCVRMDHDHEYLRTDHRNLDLRYEGLVVIGISVYISVLLTNSVYFFHWFICLYVADVINHKKWVSYCGILINNSK